MFIALRSKLVDTLSHETKFCNDSTWWTEGGTSGHFHSPPASPRWASTEHNLRLVYHFQFSYEASSTQFKFLRLLSREGVQHVSHECLNFNNDLTISSFNGQKIPTEHSRCKVSMEPFRTAFFSLPFTTFGARVEVLNSTMTASLEEQ